MPRGLQRFYGKDELHFITVSCYRRLPLLRSTQARNLLVKTLGEVRDGLGFALAGYVVMPEHVHLLIGEPERGTPSTVLQVLKQRASREARSWERDDLDLSQFWQRRFYDFNVWSRWKTIEKLHYMHMNPVRRGLVRFQREWIWSSYLFYEGRVSALIRIDPV